MKKILIILFSLLFTFQVANADNLNQKKVFCENESEDFFIEFIENKIANFTWANYPLGIFEQKVEFYELKELLGDSVVSIGGINISRTKLQILSLSGYGGECRLVKYNLDYNIKLKFDKLQKKKKKKKELKF